MPADRLFHRRAGHSRKVNGLTDFEFRVWWAYVMAADDFGILRHSHVELQSMCDALAAKKSAVVMRALEHIVSVDLLKTFSHQHQTYVYQWDWQDWQRVKWPTKTINPCPPIESLSESTRLLFQVFPGGQQVPKKFRGSTSEVPLENFDGSFPRQQTANANGEGLVANDGGSPEGDVLFARFTALYPDSGRRGGPLVEQAFLGALSVAGERELFAALENHVASEQWSVAKKVPGMDKWFRERRWLQRLDPPQMQGTNSRTAGNAEAARQFLENHGVITRKAH